MLCAGILGQKAPVDVGSGESGSSEVRTAQTSAAKAGPSLALYGTAKAVP